MKTNTSAEMFAPVVVGGRGGDECTVYLGRQSLVASLGSVQATYFTMLSPLSHYTASCVKTTNDDLEGSGRGLFSSTVLVVIWRHSGKPRKSLGVQPLFKPGTSHIRTVSRKRLDFRLEERIISRFIPETPLPPSCIFGGTVFGEVS